MSRKKRTPPEEEPKPTTEDHTASALDDPVAAQPAAEEATAEEAAVQAVDELEAERARADENYDKYLRAVAELDNFRKRTRQEMEEFRKYAAEGLASQLLEVVDNLERAIESAQTEGDVSTLAQGVLLTLRQLVDILDSHGVRAIEAEGHRFDPNLHEAVLRVEAEPDMDNVVVEELQRGYTLHGRVLRPAMVKVGLHSEPGDEARESVD